HSGVRTFWCAADRLGVVLPTDRGSLEWDTYAFAFGHRLVTIRKARGLSQEQLAERSGMHRNAVSNLERATSNGSSGVADPLMSTVYRLARALDVAPVLLLPGADGRLPDRAAEQESNEALSEIESQLLAMLTRENDTQHAADGSERLDSPARFDAHAESPGGELP
ncbi:helix-turn-helix domain-containing protein, partial [Gordonia sp. (in: high G+C Gram-positive bacteria)]|uniref:helix-turn-helix domain-containing protein n=1 Tax=Gordonia sp. (in: high G+C Gram-positive bacteria) TaxID=84139 RepID=UPI003C731D19